MGHDVTVVSQAFQPEKLESFFGYEALFSRVKLLLYPPSAKDVRYGTATHLIHHLQYQKRAFKRLKHRDQGFDFLFSTQDEGYVPDVNVPVIQWGYFPRYFPNFLPGSLAKATRALPLRLHYKRKVSRVGLVLAISQYAKTHLDKEWRRPTVLVYPACNLVDPREKRNLVVTVARAIPLKRLELFWEVARSRPEYEFVMLLTQDPALIEYSTKLSKAAPSNGRTVFNAQKDTYHKLLGEARVYVHLMKEEPFGITVVEAMSAFCVPIVHDSGGPREIVGEVGFRWRNIEEVPGMIDEAMKRSPSAPARQRAEDFSFERFEKKLSSVFFELRA